MQADDYTFHKVLSGWPETIGLEGAIIDHSNNLAWFPKLSKAWDTAEKAMQCENELQMCWVVFQEFHRLAVLNAKQGILSVRKADLDQARILGILNDTKP